MSEFIHGESQTQSTPLSEHLDNYICEENPVRVTDIFVDGIDLSRLGFKTTPADTGRPAYHPSTMLKLFIYRYLNPVPSSRGLELEAGRSQTSLGGAIAV